MKIMLVDDEESIRVLVEMIVIENGYDFCYAANGEEALARFEQEQPDLIILDIMMARMNGFVVCEHIRRFSNVPIIILSAKGDIVDKSIGFHAGADDYLVKPFSSVELALRIDALLRRHEIKDVSAISDNLAVGKIEINFKRHEVIVEGAPVEFTPKEFKILSYMASHPGEVFSKDQIQDYVWGEDYAGELTGLAVFIRKIREKIEKTPSRPKYLLTVWGTGYKFVSPHEKR